MVQKMTFIYRSNDFFNPQRFLTEGSTFNVDSEKLAGMGYYICKIIQKEHKPVIGIIKPINYREFDCRIIPHEQVNKDKVNNYIDQFIEKGILNNPILLFYKKFPEFQDYLKQIIYDMEPNHTRCIDNTIYEVWSINSAQVMIKLQSYFNGINELYVADGHHRIQALLEIYSRSTTNFPYEYISFVVQEDDLKLATFNRFIKGINVSTDILMNKLKRDYSIKQVGQKTLNFESSIYFYLNQTWYQLKIKKQKCNNKFHCLPHVNIDKFITSILMSSSEMTGEILYSPGTDRIDEILQFFQENRCQLAIHIPRLSLADLYDITKSCHTLPTHSTYFTPKIPNNLFIQKFEFLNNCFKNMNMS